MDFGPGLEPLVYSHDEEGRLEGITRGEFVRTHGYDSLSRLESIEDGVGRRVEFGHDEANRVTSMRLPSGRTYGYAYDENGSQTRVIMPGGGIHAFEYGSSNRLTRYTTPDDHEYVTIYGADEAILTQSLPSGRRKVYEYGPHGEVSMLSFPEGSVTFESLSGPACCGSIQASRIPADGDGRQDTRFERDGFLPSRTTWSGVANGVYTYRWDENFLLVGLTLDDRVETQYRYDDDGLLVANGPFTATRDGPLGRATRIEGEGAVTTLGYDRLGRLESRSLTVAGVELWSMSLGRDATGRITSRTEWSGGAATVFSFEYDVDGQILSVQRDDALVESWEYCLLYTSPSPRDPE